VISVSVATIIENVSPSPIAAYSIFPSAATGVGLSRMSDGSR
jgi:hypothetical protein